MNIRFFSILLALAGTGAGQAQTALEWVNSFGANGFNDRGFGVGVDSQDNIYLGGDFTLTVDFDPGPETHELTATVEDPFLAKYDADGNFIWARHLAGRGLISDIAIDGEDNVLIAGRFSQALAMDAKTTLNPVSSNDIFFAKFDPEGNLLWAHSIGGNGDDETLGITVDSGNSLILAGVVRISADLDPGPGEAVVTAGIDSDSIIAKYDSNGNFAWGHVFEQTVASSAAVSDSINAVHVDPDDNVFAVGLYKGTTDFAGTVLASDTSDAYIIMMNSGGVVQWVNSSSGTGTRKEHFTVGQDSAGNLYVSGIFIGTMDFNPDPKAEEAHTSADSLDMYLASYEASGDFRWVGIIGGAGTELVMDMIVGPNGASILGGQYTGPTDFDPGSGEVTRTAVAGWDCYFVGYDPSGALVGLQTLDGTPTFGGEASAIEALSLAAGGELIIAGQYRLGVDFDPGEGELRLISEGGNDAFLARYGLPDLIFGDGFEETALALR